MTEPYDAMAKYGNSPSRSQLYRKSKMRTTSVQYKDTPETPMQRNMTFLESLRVTPGVVQRSGNGIGQWAAGQKNSRTGIKPVVVNRSGKGNKQYVMGE